MAVTAQAVWTARSRIAPVVRRTPLVESPVLSEQLNATVCLKLETLHPTGAFKLRGAANRILSLSPAEQRRGVATFSTGNHGVAVAYVARQLGIPAVVCISERVPRAKVDVLRRLGARVEVHGAGQDEAEARCYDLEREQGLTVVKPFDDPDVIAGQGTIGLELLEDCPGLDTVVVPLSGGGLIAGIALALKANHPSLRVVGVSMERGAVMYHSLRAGAPVTLPEEPTLADSLLGGIGQENRYTFRLVQELVDETVLVPEDAIARAMAFLFQRHRLVAEGAAATGIAALQHHPRLVQPGSRVAVIITGHNVDLGAFLAATRPYLEL